MHGESVAFAAHCRLWKPLSSSIRIASPGATSRTTWNPSESSATLSDATTHSGPSSLSFEPITSGRMPCGSRKASTPQPAIIATTAYAPRTRRWTFATAAKTVSGSSRVPLAARSSSCARTFSNTSESEFVLMCRRSVRNISSLSWSELVRLPLCPSTMPNGEFT